MQRSKKSHTSGRDPALQLCGPAWKLPNPTNPSCEADGVGKSSGSASHAKDGGARAHVHQQEAAAFGRIGEVWWRLEGPKEDHRRHSGSRRAPITRRGEANGGHWWQEEKVLWCKFKVLGVWYWASESGVRAWWVYSFPFQQPPTLQKASVKLRYVPCSLFSSLQLFLFHFAFGT